MTDYILIALSLIIIFILERHRCTLSELKDWLYELDSRQSSLEEVQEIAYMVPYEHNGKKGKKKISTKLFEDKDHLIYEEEGTNRICHEQKNKKHKS